MVPDAVNTPVPTTPVYADLPNLRDVASDALHRLAVLLGVPEDSVRFLKSVDFEEAERSMSLADRLLFRQLVEQAGVNPVPVTQATSEGHSDGRSYISDYLREAVVTDRSGTDTKRISATAQLPIPDGIKYAGEDDIRPVSAWVRSFSQVVRIYRLDADTCWSFLIRAVDASVLSDIFDFLEESSALGLGTVTRLSMTERFLGDKYRITDDPVRWRERFDSVKQGPSERVTTYYKRVKKMVSAGRCIDVNLSESEVLKRFIEGLRADYKKVVNQTYAHYRSLEILARDLSYWEDRNYGIRMDQTEKSNDKVKTVDQNVPESVLSISTTTGTEVDATPSKDTRQCYFCHKFGHLKRNCPARYQWLARKGLVRESSGEVPKATTTPIVQTEALPVSTVESTSKVQASPPVVQSISPKMVSAPTYEKVAMVRDVDDDEISRLDGGVLHDPVVSIILRQDMSKDSTVRSPGARVKALIDSGARGFVYMSRRMFLALASEGILRRTLTGATGVSFGNGHSVEVDGQCEVDICSAAGDLLVSSSCKVVDGLTPDVIFGNALLRRCSTLVDSLLEFYRSVVVDADSKVNVLSEVDTVKAISSTSSIECREDGRYVAHCQILENALMQPFCEAIRRRPRSRQIAIYRRLKIACGEGKMREVGPDQINHVNEVVLVDKKPGEPLGNVEHMTDPVIRKRFRVTVDCRRLNSMKLAMVPGSDAHQQRYWWANDRDVSDTVPSSFTTQSQQNALSILLSWPLSYRKVYFKVDLEDAFSSVLLPEGMLSYFTVRAYDGEGNLHYFQPLCLVQGWRYSPIIFTRCMDHYLREVRSEAARLDLDFKIEHFQDDVLGGASCKEDAVSGRSLVTSVGRRHHFIVSEEKSEIGVRVTFCGLICQGLEVSPVVKDAAGLSESAVARSLKEYDALIDDEAKRKWIRSWAGRFQWLRRWLPYGSHGVLHKLHKLTSSPSSIAIEHVTKLCRNYFSGLLSLYVVGGSTNTPILGSCLIVDTNKEAWSCMLLQIFSVPKDEVGEIGQDGPWWLSELDDLTKEVCHGLGLLLPYDRDAVMLPLAVDGCILTPSEIKRSSTVKERRGMIRAVTRNLALITTPLAVVCDNKNSSAWWNEIELDYADSEEEYRGLLLYQRTVWVTLWSSRQGCVSYIDALARGVNEDNRLEDRDIHIVQDPLQELISRVGECDQADMLRMVSDDEEQHNAVGFVIAPCLIDIDFDFEKLKADQRICPACESFKSQTGFTMVDGILYREQRFDEVGRIQRQLVIPSTWINWVVSESHKRTHASGRQLKSWLQRWCWFSKMGTKCRWAKSVCPTCQRVDSDGRIEVPYSTRLPDAKALKPWYRVGVDGVVVKRGCLFLTVTDAFSGYMDFTIIDSTDAATFIRGLSIIFVRNGFPREVQSDGEFGSKEVQDWAKAAGIRWILGPANHGQTGGFYERRHRCLLECLRRWLADLPSVEWADELLLQNVKWMINHTELGESQLTPMMIMWGRICELPCMRSGSIADDSSSVSDPELYDLIIAAGRISREHEVFTAKFVEHWLDQREKNHPVLRYDSGLRVGMWVMVYTQRSYKLSPCWRGPYRISAIKSRHVLLTTERGTEFHHIGNCKRFRSADNHVSEEDSKNDLKDDSAEGSQSHKVPNDTLVQLPQGRPKRQAAMLSQATTSNMLRDERRAVVTKRRRVA
ncbi:gag/pol/env polyprotein, putative [Perkinsus marinus ATCC 50983]|uniref:Gag/pol/env polyprotein, putative n=1 Tax=Perkinsus marinus (strain ATCC 50983 / TXsc) TaxID=423536 RepID=C5K9U9_PERM5|nr:gag/pol/env polyprotein, putative [Perkinsus marinus ATCC 50983]EER18871.1 gag/pol/env polyprotein, putative [Perkinsus marinus ATCC 50983]|eukprot:XP_002787075.1 gag/pol/env polyprotein, putative [Perkinsus marinus ATCC 50983]